MSAFGTWLLLGALAQDGLVFREPDVAPASAFTPVVREGGTVGIDLELPIIRGGKGLRYPFSEPVARIELLTARGVPPAPALAVIVAGGVRTSLSYHVLRSDGGRVSVRFPGARLLQGFVRPLVDSASAVLVCLFTDRDGVQLRVVSVSGDRAKLLLARTLERTPERLQLRPLLPRVQVRLGQVALRAPGETGFRLPETPPSFVHPRATLPRLSTVRLDLGALVRGERGSQSFELANPGSFPLRLLLRGEPPAGWQLDLEPSVLTLPPGARSKIRVTLECREPTVPVATTVAVRGLGDDGDPLAQLLVSARGAPAQDSEPPVLDRSRLDAQLLPGRRARMRGRRGAVRDESRPIQIGDASGATCEVGEDGSFELEVALRLDGRVLLWVEDGRGNRSKPRYVMTILDEKAPRWDPAKVTLELPVEGRTRIRGAAGAVRDETPPIWIEISVDGKRHDSRARVAPDGSFSAQVFAVPAQKIRLEAIDGAAPLNRSRPLGLGPVLPYVAQSGDGLVLHGPPGARFKIAPTLPARDGAPETVLTILRGELDSGGTARIDEERLRGARLVRFAVTVPGSGRILEGRYQLRR